jgi:hypothetical protein
MADSFVIPDVSTEAIMNLAKAVSSSSQALSLPDIVRAFERKYGDAYISYSITA